jgi:hypothetical protein
MLPAGHANVGLHLPDAWYLADLRGAAPHPPRGGTLTVPQTPPQVTWSDCASAVADASAAMSASGHKRNGGWQRMAGELWVACYASRVTHHSSLVSSPLRLFISSPPRLYTSSITASHLLPRVRRTEWHPPRATRTTTGPPCEGHGGAAPQAGWRGWPRPRVRGAPPREPSARLSRN